MAASLINTSQFNDLLTVLMSADNEVRGKAEAEYEKIDGQEKCFLLLWALGNDELNLEEAELASVLFRRLISSEYDTVFATLGSGDQDNIKTQLLLLLSKNINPMLKRKICDLTAELARNCIDEQGNSSWPEIWQFLFHSATSADPLAKEIALLMLSFVPSIFGNQQDRFLDGVCEILRLCLLQNQPEQVRYAAAKATTALLLANEKETAAQRLFIPCLELLLNFFSQVLDSTDGEPEEILRHLVDLVETCPQLFKSQLESLLQYCLRGLTHRGYTDSCNHLSLEVIVTLCETAPSMVKKFSDGRYIPVILREVLKMMTYVEDDPNWDIQDDENSDDDGDSTPIVAEASLDRLACALGGKTVFPLLATPLARMIHSPDWNERYAGLMGISAIGEGCHKKMTDSLSEIVVNVLPFLGDTDQRVRYAACNALGQMSSDFAPNFQKRFALQVIPQLLLSLSNPTSPRVQAHAGAALVNFFEDCPKNILAPHMNDIVLTLGNVLISALNQEYSSEQLKMAIEQYKEMIVAAGDDYNRKEHLVAKLMELELNLQEFKKQRVVLEQVVVTLAALADSAQEKFCEFYEKFMPHLKTIIKITTNDKKRSMLRGKTIECVSLIGLAVGREKFLADANEVMNLLSSTQIEDDDPQLSYMIAAWARICKILGSDFNPYLPYVMQPVLKAAAIKPEIAVLDADDMKAVGNNDDWEFVTLGEKHNFGIRTSGLDEKATACQMLVCYAKELKEGFVDYVKETVDLMVPMLRFYFHDGVRIAAGEILPYLLESAKCRGEDYVRQMWAVILPAILNALDAEPECEVLCELFAAFSQCIDVLGGSALKEEDIGTLMPILHKNLVAHFERSQTREYKRKEDEDDDVLEENLMKEEDEDVFLLGKVSEIICTMFSTYKQAFFVYFDQLLPHFIHLIGSGQPWTDQQWALCVFADIIENTGPDCSRYQQYFLQPILTSLAGKNADLRQTAAYTLGVLGQYGGSEFAEFCFNSSVILMQIINSADSRSEENVRATENAISAVTKFLMYHSFLDIEAILPLWLSWLPVWEDEEEINCIYGYLCSLLETLNPVLIGEDSCNLPRIIQIVAETFHKQAIDVASDLGKRIITLMNLIKTNNEAAYSACIAALTPQQQQALNSALASH